MTRISQSSTFLLDVLTETRAGRLIPAAFQRPYVWTPHDVEALWESIQEDCPIGIFLLWRPHPDLAMHTVGRTRLGPIMANAIDRPAIILDGQNRLATLAWSLLGPDDAAPDAADLDPQEAATWRGSDRLVADPANDRIHFRPHEEARSHTLYAPAIVAETTLLNREIRARDRAGPPVSDEVMTWLDRLGERMRSMRTIVWTLENATPDEALRHFKRIARAGVPMSEDDLKRAVGLMPR